MGSGNRFRITWWESLPVVAMVILAAAVMLGAMWLSAHVPRAPRDHLCPVAEISPDITPAERQRCRQLRAIKL